MYTPASRPPALRRPRQLRQQLQTRAFSGTPWDCRDLINVPVSAVKCYLYHAASEFSIKPMEINRAVYRAGGIAALLSAALVGLAPSPVHQRSATSTATSNSAHSDGKRTILIHDHLFAKNAPAAPLDDSAAFAMPANAEAATESFEGTLALNDSQSSGNFTALSDIFQIIPDGDSPWKHLPPFRYQFVASGEYLIPAQQGLAITGSPA